MARDEQQFERKPALVTSSRHEVYLKIPLDSPNWRIDWNTEQQCWTFFGYSQESIEDAKGKLMGLATTIIQELNK